MQTITMKPRADRDGLLRLEIPTDMADREVEIVLVMQALDYLTQHLNIRM